MTSPSVLVIEDEEPIQLVLRETLERLGFEIKCVGAKREASKVIAREHFDVIITDVLLPDGDGIELIIEIKKRQPQARIIAMSGDGKYLTSANCLRIAKGLGAHVVLAKPFTEQELLAALRLSSVAPCEMAP